MQKSFIVKHEQADWQPLLQSELWHEPLSEARLLQLTAELGNSLVQRHAREQLYGQWSLNNVFVHEGHCYLVDQPVAQPSPFMAFEQLANDGSWEVGTAVDVYGLGMLLRSLITKKQPPLASTRWVETLPALGRVGVVGIRPRLLRAIELATELDPQFRLAKVEELLLYMNLTFEQPASLSTLASAPPVRDGSSATMESVASGLNMVKAPLATAQALSKNRWVYIVLLVLALLGTLVLLWPPGNPDLPARTDALASLPTDSTPAFLKGDASEFESSALLPEPLTVESPALLPEPPTEERDANLDNTESLNPDPDLDESLPQLQTPSVLAQPEPIVTITSPPALRPESVKRQADPASTVEVHLAIFPWGEVYVNNRRQGASPPLKTLKLKPGTYQVQIRNGDLPPYSTSLNVGSKDTGLTISHRF